MRKLDIYYRIRNEIRAGDAFTWKGEGITQPVAKIIQWWVPDGYHVCNHISTVVTAPKYADRLMMMEATGHTGVVPIAISHRIKNFKGNVWWHPLNSNVIPFDARIEMERWLWKQAWKEYDFDGCSKNALAYASENTRKLFCSELYVQTN